MGQHHFKPVIVAFSPNQAWDGPTIVVGLEEAVTHIEYPDGAEEVRTPHEATWARG